MKAAVFHDRRDLRVDDAPEPEARPGGAKIGVGRCGRVNAGALVTSRVSLSDVVEDGFEESAANGDRHAKILVQPSG